MPEFVVPPWPQNLIFQCVRLTRHYRQIHCLAPPQCWFKLTIHGSCRGEPGHIGAGGVLRNEKFQRLLSEPWHWICSWGRQSYEAMPMPMFDSERCRQIEVECDSSVAVFTVIRSHRDQSSPLQPCQNCKMKLACVVTAVVCLEQALFEVKLIFQLPPFVFFL